MISLEILLITAFGAAFLVYLLGKVSAKLRNFSAVFVSLFLTAFVFSLYGKSGSVHCFSFLNLPLVLRVNMFSWLFAVTISVVSALSVIFSLSYMSSVKDKTSHNFYYLMMFLVNAAMLGIVMSADLLSFYVFWEIMSWSAFLLISYNKGPALAAGMKYIVMSVIGSCAMLVGVVSLYVNCRSLDIMQVSSFIARAPLGYVLFILIVFSIAFGIKNAIVPFHTWLPDAHSEAPTPFSAVLSGILIKMGTYGFILFIYVIAGLNIFLNIGRGDFYYIFSLLAGVTIIVPTFIAVLQDDAKRMLAWSSIAQAGYIILGIVSGTSLGFAGGVFHFLNHASFKSLLFLSVGAVAYRTGTRDLNSMGGLVKKMPVTFFCALAGVLGLIGVPLTNGFVSKWLIYKTLILKGHLFLAFAALFGTWGTILYSYKLIHNIFLGQLPEKFNGVREVPVSMRFSIVTLSAAVIIFGILPGIPLKVINSIGVSFGLEPLNVNIWGITSAAGGVNMINIFTAVLLSAVFVWFIFKAGKKKIDAAQDDNYAAGLYVPKDKYNYTVEFYRPLSVLIKPYCRDFVDKLYSWSVSMGRKLSNRTRKIYCGDISYYVAYIVSFLAALIAFKLWGRIW